VIIYKTIDDIAKVSNNDLTGEEVLVVGLNEVIDKSTDSSFPKFREYGVYIHSFKKQKYIREISTIIRKNDEDISVFFIDESYISKSLLDLSGSNKNIYINLSSKTDPREYELLFNLYRSKNISGINFDIEKITKGHIALCDKFQLNVCVEGVNFERQLEKAKDLNVDAVLI